MAYHDDLLNLAFDLVVKDPDPTQAELRRAVSTAYYALFHLLISETTENWSRASSRNALGRIFDHKPMKRVSDRHANPKSMPFTGEDQAFVSNLRLVAKSFVQLQDQRHIADYDNGTVWTSLDSIDEVTRSLNAFEARNKIKHTDIAQEYLVSLLIRPRD
jgi:hypothetical protein